MTRAECRHCGRNAYKDGKCFADFGTGKPIETYTACDWARKKVTNKKTKRYETNGN